MAPRRLTTPGYCTAEATGGSAASPLIWAHDWLLYPGLAIGATGSISGAAALLPRPVGMPEEQLERIRAALKRADAVNLAKAA